MVAKTFQLIIIAALATTLTGCAGAVNSSVRTPKAPNAAQPKCAKVIAALTKNTELGGASRRQVASQSIAAWGTGGAYGAAVVLRCGVTETAPSSAPCVNVAGVDWQEVSTSTNQIQTGQTPTETTSNQQKLITFGRVPLLEITVDTSNQSQKEQNHTDAPDKAKLANPKPSTDLVLTELAPAAKLLPQEKQCS